MTASAAARLQVGGALGLDELYITRPEDQTAYDLLARREYVNILTSRQMGKSSLMFRLIDRLQRECDARVVSIDMAGDLGTPADSDRWYIGFLERVVRDLEITDGGETRRFKVAEWWVETGVGTPNQRLLQFFRDVVVATAESPVYVFVDEIDATLKLSYSDDFFTALRSIFNQRPTEPTFRHLTFCLVGVASPFELIKDPRTTPYNIAHTVELRDFEADVDDLNPLRAALAESKGDGGKLLDAVLRWTGGHPFLTVAVCSMARERGVKQPEEVDALLEGVLAKGTSQETKDHLETISNFLANRLENQAASFKLYNRVLRGRRVPDRLTPAHVGLRLSGLVKRNRAGELISRNQLYRRRFGRSWLKQTKPMRDQARVVWIAAAASVTAVAVIAGLLWTFLRPQPYDVVNEKLGLMVAAESNADPKAWLEARDKFCNALVDRRAAAPLSLMSAAHASHVRYWRKRLDASITAALAGGQEAEALLLGALAATLEETPGERALDERVREAYLASIWPKVVATLRGHTKKATRVRFLGNGRVISASADETVRVFDLASGKQIAERSIGYVPTLLEVCPDGTCVLINDEQSGVRVLTAGELRDVPLLDSPRTHESAITAVAMAASGDATAPAWIAFGDKQGKIRVGRFDLAGSPAMAKIIVTDTEGHPFVAGGEYLDVYALSFTADARHLVTAAYDGMRIYAVDDQGSITAPRKAIPFTQPDPDDRNRRIPAPPYELRASAKPGSNRIAIAVIGSSEVYDVAGEKPDRFTKDNHTFLTASLSADDALVANAVQGSDGSGLVLVWERTSSDEWLGPRTDAVSDAVFGTFEGANVVASAHADGLIRVWRPLSPKKPTEPSFINAADRWTRFQRKLGYSIRLSDNTLVPLADAGVVSAEDTLGNRCGEAYPSTSRP